MQYLVSLASHQSNEPIFQIPKFGTFSDFSKVLIFGSL